jgi:hypothetical protein
MRENVENILIIAIIGLMNKVSKLAEKFPVNIE